MPSFTITVSDALATRLRDRYGTLANLRNTIRDNLKAEIVDEEVGAFRTERERTLRTTAQTETDAERARLEALL
jgi:hypothetical protein